MTDLHRSSGDDDLTRLLRERYAAPAGDDYWRGLEGRIMAHVRDAAAEAWWQPFGGWVRAGMAAAAATLLITGASLLWSGASSEPGLYRAVLDAPAAPLRTAGESGTSSAREATLEYLITH